MAKEKKSKAVTAIPSKRLKKCFASGGITGLFPLLKDWPVRELKALLRDVEAFYSDTTKILDAKSKEFSGLLESAVDHGVLIKALGSARKNVNLHLMEVCSEIDSVALYWIEQRKLKK